MAVPPNVPTSFVPRPAHGTDRISSDLSGAFAFLCYIALFIVLISALGVFIYDRILEKSRTSYDTELSDLEKTIDPATVDEFIRLRDRLSESKRLLGGHVAPSTLFEELERVTLTNVALSSFNMVMNNQGEAVVNISGIAKNFNALAAESQVFSKDPHMKEVIFSNIRVGNTGEVNFSLNGTADASLLEYAPEPKLSAPATSSSTPSGGATETP